MGNCRTEWRLRRALRVQMNVLVIASRIGELINALLIDYYPISEADFFTDKV